MKVVVAVVLLCAICAGGYYMLQTSMATAKPAEVVESKPESQPEISSVSEMLAVESTSEMDADSVEEKTNEAKQKPETSKQQPDEKLVKPELKKELKPSEPLKDEPLQPAEGNQEPTTPNPDVPQKTDGYKDVEYSANGDKMYGPGEVSPNEAENLPHGDGSVLHPNAYKV